MLQGDVVGHPVAVRGRYKALLGVAAVERAAQDAQLAVEVAQARKPGVLGHPGHRRIGDHPVAGLPLRDLRADLGHYARDVHARDMGEGEPRHVVPAVALQHVEPVEGSSRHVEHHVAGPRDRRGHVRVLQHLGPARSPVQHRLHVASPIRLGGCSTATC